MEDEKAVARFAVGRVVGTPGALAALATCGQSPAEFLDRHAGGDWGQVSATDGLLNDDAISAGDRVVSAYDLSSGVRIWIITEADRSSTCVLLPDEY